LRALAGLIPSEGLLRLGETDPRLASPAELARLRAYCAQRPVCAWDYRVGELGEIVGRPTAYAGWLAQLEMEGHAERRLSSLSGGELKAAHLAMTFAQLEEPFGKALLLDEPAAALDLRRQEAVVRALRRFAADGAACLVATHELRFAQGCDQALVLAEGRMIAAGPPAAALTPAIVDEAWGRAPA
jgi:iron complex transport system ATP-binding protein